jgi:hypothetical protein
MTRITTIPSGRIGFYYLCRGTVIAVHSQRPVDGYDTGILIIPRFNPYEEISLAAEVEDGHFELYIRHSHTPDGSIVYRHTTQSYVVFHNEPFTDEILGTLCQRFHISTDAIEHEGIEGNPW